MTRRPVFVVAVAASFVSAQVPAFDVVSIKESTSNSGSGSAGPEGPSRFVATNCPASSLLNMDWRLPNGRVIGAPDWTSRINARSGLRACIDGVIRRPAGHMKI